MSVVDLIGDPEFSWSDDARTQTWRIAAAKPKTQRFRHSFSTSKPMTLVVEIPVDPGETRGFAQGFTVDVFVRADG